MGRVTKFKRKCFLMVDGFIGHDLRGTAGVPGPAHDGGKVPADFTLQYGGFGQQDYTNYLYNTGRTEPQFTSFYIPFSVKLKNIILYTASIGVGISIGLYKSNSKLNNDFDRIVYISDVIMDDYAFPVIIWSDILLEPGNYLFAWKIFMAPPGRSLLMRPLSSVGYPEVIPGPFDFYNFDCRSNLVYSNYMIDLFPQTIDLFDPDEVSKVLHEVNEPRGMVPVFSLKCDPV